MVFSKKEHVPDELDILIENMKVKTDFEHVFYKRKIKKSLMGISNKKLLKRILFEKKGKIKLNNYIPKQGFPVYDIALKLEKAGKGVSYNQRVALINVLSQYYAQQGLKNI